MATTTGRFDAPLPASAGRTFAKQDALPRLPIPPLADTCKRYLHALKALQTPEEHEASEEAVRQFLEDQEEGPRAQKMLEEYAKDKDRCARALVGKRG